MYRRSGEIARRGFLFI